LENERINKKTVISSLIYKFSERLSVKGIGLLISIILARLLAPDVFGQIAILTVFITLSQTIIQSGLNVALVQNKETTDDDFSTVFYISTGLAVLLICALYFIAPLVSSFYYMDALTWPLRVYSLSLLFGAFNSVQLARMERLMQFRRIMYCSLTATVLSGSLGVVLAYKGAGLWSLVLYYFSNVVIDCIAMFAIQRWLPGLVFSVERGKVLFSYGWKILVSALLCSVYYDLNSLIIGKKFSGSALGYYNRGQQFPNIIATTLDGSIQSVMLPTLSAFQDDNEKLKELLKRTVVTSALFVVPAMVGLAVVAKPLIVVLITDKWLPCVVFMQLFCITEATIPYSSSNLVVIKAMGRSDVYMKLEIVRRTVMLIILLISVLCFDSVMAIAWGYVISTLLDVVIISVPVKRMLGYGITEQLKDTRKIIIASVIMGAAVLPVGGLKLSYLLLLSVEIGVGIAVYCAACKLLRVESFLLIETGIKRILFKKER